MCLNAQTSASILFLIFQPTLWFSTKLFTVRSSLSKYTSNLLIRMEPLSVCLLSRLCRQHTHIVVLFTTILCLADFLLLFFFLVLIPLLMQGEHNWTKAHVCPTWCNSFGVLHLSCWYSFDLMGEHPLPLLNTMAPWFKNYSQDFSFIYSVLDNVSSASKTIGKVNFVLKKQKITAN